MSKKEVVLGFFWNTSIGQSRFYRIFAFYIVYNWFLVCRERLIVLAYEASILKNFKRTSLAHSSNQNFEGLGLKFAIFIFSLLASTL